MNMQETNKPSSEIITAMPITPGEINQIRKIYKLDFPCPHCKEKINDDHFGQEQRVFQLIDEKLKEIIEKHLNLQKNYLRNEFIEEIKKNRIYEDFPEIKQLKQNVEKLKNQVIEANSSEYVEGLSRVRELKGENEKLREQNQMLQHLSKKGGQEKGKEFENNEWIAKLEKDMETHRADYGFIVATCENDKPIRPLDTRKKIYISGDNINIFIVAKIMRELLITKCNFETLVKSDEKEQKLKKLKDWIEYKLPRYISILEDELNNQEKEADIIIREAGKIKKSKERI
ncbi:17328_t:CDS:2 [Funneliformis geosporum]|uniref:17328_t:CDS:1 n=1 Tax=Funneliformis geosporum TaxID=1117311 RepID=A0A9W4SY34_9GLOM|nr:17328_t:CDS:2 [Funneliformis geosporum]